VAVADYAVGVFAYARSATAVDPIAVHYSNNQLVTPTSPAAPGEILVAHGTAAPMPINATVSHTLETVAQGSSLQVWLDSALLTFTQNGASVTTVSLAATSGSNNGTAGIAFADEDNRGKSGQQAKNLAIAQVGI